MDGRALQGRGPWSTVREGDGEQTQGEDVGLAQRGLPVGTGTAEGGGSPGGAVQSLGPGTDSGPGPGLQAVRVGLLAA